MAIAEMTPGPLGLNCATFAGMRTAGLLGAIAANLGTLSPTLTVCLLAAIFFERFRKSSFMTRLMTGVRPACVGMIFGVVISLCATNYAAEPGGVSWPAIRIGALGLLLLVRFKVSILKVICLSGAGNAAVGDGAELTAVLPGFVCVVATVLKYMVKINENASSAVKRLENREAMKRRERDRATRARRTIGCCGRVCCCWSP